VGALQKQNETQELGSAIANLYKTKEEIVRRQDKLETRNGRCDNARIQTAYSKILQRKNDQKIKAEHDRYDCEKQLALFITHCNRRLTRGSSSETYSKMSSKMGASSSESSSK
jgi:hypothetical protein